MSSETEKMDNRVIKSHRDIRAAFVELLHEKPFEHITVQNILERAIINRNTFYKYYSGKSALAGAMISDFKAEYANWVQQRFSSQITPNTLMNLAPALFAKRKLLLALWKIETKRHHLYADMLDLVKQGFMQSAHMQQPEKSINYWDYQATLYATLALTSLRYYFERNEPLPVNELIKAWQEMVNVASWNSQ